MGKSSIRGGPELRRLLKNLPDDARADIVSSLERSGPVLANVMAARLMATTKSRTGNLLRGIKWKVYPKALRLRVGLIGSKAQRKKLFYGNVLNYGRKERDVPSGPAKTPAARKSRVAELAERYSDGSKHVGRIAPNRFVTGGAPILKREVGARINGMFDRILSRIGR